MNRTLVDLVAHSYHVREVIQQVYSDIRDAERTQRGYLITDDPVYLKLYQKDINNAHQIIRQLQYLIADNPRQVRNLSRLTQLSQDRIVGLNQVTAAKDHVGLGAAKKLILTNSNG